MNKLKHQPLNQNLFNKAVVHSKTEFFKIHVFQFHGKLGFLVNKFLPQKNTCSKATTLFIYCSLNSSLKKSLLKLFFNLLYRTLYYQNHQKKLLSHQ